MKTCTIQGCERKHQAKGYCGSHYNQILKPNRHRKEAVACDWCGTTCYKEPSRHNKYQHVYCTLQCRDTHRTALSRLQAGPPLNFLGYWFNCEHCGSEFHTKAINGKYCSTPCSSRAHARARVKTQTEDEWLAFNRKCMECGQAYRHKRQNRLHCSDRCRDIAADKRGAVLHRGWIRDGIRKAIYERDGYVCWICNKLCDTSVDPQTHNDAPTLDHIIPRSKGGTHEESNLKTAHRICNSLRGDGGVEVLF
ncbi:HNH endonuclease [Jonesia denitrificans DSM 20603]|uniref:HNH endonuclease n=3 Tax=Jonesia TaxID=43673 RepID=C7R1G4_JONDD|nr:HNH endonuclease [Jonesia denitrificans DSM 20603]SQH22432.1 HNH endonuclease [Jonesia denitrificans]